MKVNLYELYKENTNRVDLLVIFLLLLATFLIYSQTMHFGIVLYDDDIFITNNPHILNGFTMQNLVWSASTYVNANYAPLTLWSYMLDGYIFRDWFGGFHITAFILHMLNGVTLYFISKKLTRSQFIGFFTSMLFVVHPLHVESVAWISQRKDVLSALFMFLSILFYLRHKSNPENRAHLISILMFACGMLSKVIIAPLPLALVLIDYVSDDIPDRQSLLRSLAEKWLFFAVALAVGAVNVYTQEASGALKSLASFPLSLRLENALLNYMVYPLEMFWPVDLIPVDLFRRHIPVWQWLFSGVALVMVTWIVVKFRCRHKYVFFGWVWYLLFITPVVGILQTGAHSLADRYTYISLIGPMLIVANAFRYAADKFTYCRRIYLPLSLSIVSALIGMSYVQTGYWKNTISLFTHALKVEKHNYVANNELGRAYNVKHDYKNAKKYFLLELKYNPDNDLAVSFAARYYAYIAKQPDKALVLLKARLDKPDVNRQIILNNIANVYLINKSYDKAIAYSVQALQYNQNVSSDYLIMAMAYLGKKDIKNAVISLQNTIKHDGQNVTAYKELAKIYLEAGMYKEAKLMNEQVIRINPSAGYTKQTVDQVIKKLQSMNIR